MALMATVARTRIPNPVEQPRPHRDLAAMLGSHLSISTPGGDYRVGRVTKVGLYARIYPYIELASEPGLRQVIRPVDILCAVNYDQPHGLIRNTPDIERWCPTCYAWVDAAPGDDEVAFYIEHSHVEAEHLFCQASDIGGLDSDRAVLHSTTAMQTVESWLAGNPADDVTVSVEPCPCFASQS